MAGINFIRRWVMSQMKKTSDDGIMITLPDKNKVDLNVSITMDRLIRNGIDPEQITNPQQVDNAINMINSRMVNRAIPADSAEGREITEKLFGKQKAPVFDMEGNRIPEGSGIMGGKSLKNLMDSGQVTKGARGMDKSKKVQDREMFQAANERLTSDVDTIIKNIKRLSPMDAMKEANLVIGRKGYYKNLSPEESKKILKDTEDHIFERDIPEDPEDFAIGGRVGLKGGAFLNFLKKFKIKKSGDDVKEFLSKRKFMKDIVGNTEKAKKARELREIKKNVDNYMKQYKGYQFPSDEQIKIDLEKKIQPILNKGRKLNADGGRIGYKFGLGPLFNFLNKKSPAKAYTDYLKSVKDRVKAGKEAEVAGEVIPIAAGGALITNQLKKKLKAMNEEQKKKIKQEMEKKADGGRIGYKVGSVDKMRRLILKAFGAGTAGIAAAKSGIFSGVGKGATKQVAKEVAQQTTSSMPPPYFFKLAEKIKMMGDDATATTDRTIAKTLKSKDGKSTYLLEEDVTTGDTIIKKINKEGDEMITDVEIMELKKGEVVMGKDGKPIRVPDEYEEVTEANARIEGDVYNDPYYSDGIQVDEIIKEVDDTVPSIKYASGGLAYMLGE